LNKHLSYSSISKFETCPKQFELSRTIKMPSNEAMTAGSEMHAKLAADLINKATKPSVGGERLERFWKWTFDCAHGVEEKFELDLLGQILIGYIDAYYFDAKNKNLKIVDWKSNKSNFIDEKQLKIYALALSKKYPDAETFECFFFYVNQDYYDRYFFYRDEIDEFENELFDTAQGINSTKEYKPTPGSHCSHCQYIEKCPTAKNLEVVAVNDMQTALTAAERIFAAESLVDIAKERLKSWMIDNDVSEIRVSEADRFYIMNPSPQLKTGKIKIKKGKEEKVNA